MGDQQNDDHFDLERQQFKFGIWSPWLLQRVEEYNRQPTSQRGGTGVDSVGAADGPQKLNQNQAQIIQAATKCFAGEDDPCPCMSFPASPCPSSGVAIPQYPNTWNSQNKIDSCPLGFIASSVPVSTLVMPHLEAALSYEFQLKELQWIPNISQMKFRMRA